MVLKDFYEIKAKKNLGDSHKFGVDIVINKDHSIFNGHFPDNPVMPGVCMIQIIKEITEEIVGSKLFMETCVNVKFMALINPEENSNLYLEIQISEEDQKVKVKNITKFDDTVALKFSASYQKV